MDEHRIEELLDIGRKIKALRWQLDSNRYDVEEDLNNLPENQKDPVKDKETAEAVAQLKKAYSAIQDALWAIEEATGCHIE